MPSLRATGLAFAHGEQTPLFEQVTFHLTSGFTGVVGANGAGKTTLLRLISGELSPTAGTLVVEPRSARVVVCEQTVDAPSLAIDRFSSDSGRAAQRLRAELGLESTSIARWATLSPGERKRFQVGAALNEEPDILLLDEPTNHLDREARALLQRALQRFRGIGLLIAHDRQLLAELTTNTLRIHAGSVRLYPGAYPEARALWEARAQRAELERERMKAQGARLEERLERARRDQERAHAQVSTKKRMRNRYDADARTLAAKTRASWAEAGLGCQTERLRHSLERHAERIPEFVVDKTLGRSVFARFERSPRKVLCAIERDELRAGDKLLIRDLNVVFARDARIELRGPNGAGKSSLLRELASRLTAHSERITYVPQELDRDARRAVARELAGLGRELRGQLLSVVAALGLDPERVLASPELSPGEARKVLIARGLTELAHALVLDEPTNHLDLPSIERLEAALREYPGALLLVSHDAAFAENLTDTIWDVQGERLVVSSR